MASLSTTILAAVLFVAACCMEAVHACGEQLLGPITFDRHSGGFQDWDRSDAEQDFPNGLKYTKGIGKASAGEGALRILHPQGGVGAGESGMLMRVNLPKQVDSATLSYRVKFDPSYDWTAGGKLPGLCDYECPVGCVDMNSHPGWSSRLMFRREGKAESYMYYPNMNQPGTCGLSWETSTSFTSDKWTTIKLYIKLNTGGGANGEQKVWIDGQEVLHQTGIKFRPGSGNQITQLKFENFHGGKSDVFAPSKTQYIQFDDFLVQEGFCPDDGTTFVDETFSTETLVSNDEFSYDDGYGSTDSEGPEEDSDGPMDSDGPADAQLGRFMAPGGTEELDNEYEDTDALELLEKQTMDQMIDDDDNDNHPDCGNHHEPVCPYEDFEELGRKFECDNGYHSNNDPDEPICVEYSESK